jgi:multisubunit Na+/H+ antiporter MnhE subunit
VMFVFVFDYSRWVSNWAVCMFLILHAVKMLPAARETPLIPADDTKTTIFGAIITLIPRVGIVRPF